jgi:hypothetical protein
MGYKRERKVFALHFDDPEFEGLVVKCHSLSVGELERLMGLDQDDKKSGAELIGAFVRALVSWNLEDEDGHSVPATRTGVESQDAEFILSIIGPWMQTISNIAEGSSLGKESGSGGQSLEASLPMETLSASRAS